MTGLSDAVGVDAGVARYHRCTPNMTTPTYVSAFHLLARLSRQMSGARCRFDRGSTQHELRKLAAEYIEQASAIESKERAA
jgi:hypothetical protein